MITIVAIVTQGRIEGFELHFLFKMARQSKLFILIAVATVQMDSIYLTD